MKAAQEETLLAALPQLPPEVYLVLTARRLDQRKKGVKQLKDLVEVVYCPPLKNYEAKNWLLQEAKALGLALSSRELDLLLEAKGTSLLALKSELVKIKTYCGDGAKPASAEEWRTLLGSGGDEYLRHDRRGAGREDRSGVKPPPPVIGRRRTGAENSGPFGE